MQLRAISTRRTELTGCTSRGLARRWMDLECAIAGTYNTSANAPVADDELEMVSRRYGPEEIAEERHRVARARAEIANRERD